MILMMLPFHTGCTYYLVQNTKLAEGEVKKYSTSHYMGGFGNSVVKVDCPKGVKFIQQGQSFGDQMLEGLTVGIWNPGTATITCAK
jgi:hypothetical protein